MSLDWVQKSLRELLGFAPYRGTLNIRIDSEEEIALWKEIQKGLGGLELPPPNSSFCHSRCFPVRVESLGPKFLGVLEGAILLPQVKGFPEDKVEIIFPVKVKEAFGISDGDRLSLELLNRSGED